MVFLFHKTTNMANNEFCLTDRQLAAHYFAFMLIKFKLI